MRKEKDKSRYISKQDAMTLLKTQTFPTSKTPQTLGDRAILYQKTSKNIRLTVFEGTHEILNEVVLDKIQKLD